MNDPSHSDARARMLTTLRELRGCIMNTPLRSLASDTVALFVKLEYGGFSGTVKDRAAFRMLEGGLMRGEIGPDTVVVESTSGSLGLALSGMCRLIGVRFIPVIDPLINRNTERRLRQASWDVMRVEERDEMGGYLLNRRRVVAAQRTRFPSVFVPNQYENPDNYMAYYDTLGVELSRQVPDLDYVFLAVSSGGTITGVSRRLKETCPDTRVIAVDVEGSVIFGKPAKKRHVPGIGSSLVPPNLKQAQIDEVICVSELDVIEGCEKLFKEHQVFGGASSGACYSAITKRFRARQPGAKKPRVAFICADLGDAYLETIYNPEWARDVRNELALEGQESATNAVS